MQAKTSVFVVNNRQYLRDLLCLVLVVDLGWDYMLDTVVRVANRRQ